MSVVFSTLLVNTTVAAGFGALVFLVQRWRRPKCHPAVWYALWLLVIAKLITPPVLGLPIIPSAAETTAPVQSQAVLQTAVTADEEPRPRARGTWLSIVTCIGRPTALWTAWAIMSSSSRRRVDPSSLMVIESATSAVASHLRLNASASTSNPGPRFPDDAGADAAPIIAAPAR